VAAYGGRKDIFGMLAPLGPVYQAGTLSGNPLAMAAGIAALSALKDGKIYKHLKESGDILEAGLKENIKKTGVKAVINRLGSMFTLFFTDRYVRNYEDAKTCDTLFYGRYFRRMLEAGVYIPPSQFETSFLNAAHGKKEIFEMIEKSYKSIKGLK
jgi:glutamate-1-semialdehyde 2,1-aminomutase